jgi:hypothetical protein
MCAAPQCGQVRSGRVGTEAACWGAAYRAHKEEYESFLGEDFEAYTAQMAKNATWGDELTLVGALVVMPTPTYRHVQ